jgi:multicomponent Na+:H+ antiporter subunit C
MFLLMCLVIGALYSFGFYLLMRRSMIQLLFGLLLLGNAVNLLIFAAGGLIPARPPLIELGELMPVAGSADPVPQALILTAIVISFAVTAFLAVLLSRVYEMAETDDLHELRTTEK